MKFLILIALLISCAHHTQKEKSYFIKAVISYNSQTLERLKIIVNDSQKAEMIKSKTESNHKTILLVEPVAAKMNGVMGVKLKLDIDHQSSLANVKTSQEIFVEPGKEAIFETGNKGEILETKITLTEVVRKVIE